MMHNYKLFIFDLDGTLVNSEDLHLQSLQLACRQRQLELSKDQLHNIVYGKSWGNIFKELKTISPLLFKSTDHMVKACDTHFEKLIDNKDIEIKAATDLLKKLARENEVCIVSGSSRRQIAYFIEKLDIQNEVSFFLGDEDYSEGKPAPECFIKAAGIAQVEPENCLISEDSRAGVEAAQKAKMTAVGIKNNQARQDLSAASIILPCLSQFNFELL